MSEHQHVYTYVGDDGAQSQSVRHDHEEGSKPHAHVDDSDEELELWEEG